MLVRHQCALERNSRAPFIGPLVHFPSKGPEVHVCQWQEVSTYLLLYSDF